MLYRFAIYLESFANSKVAFVPDLCVVVAGGVYVHLRWLVYVQKTNRTVVDKEKHFNLRSDLESLYIPIELSNYGS